MTSGAVVLNAHEVRKRFGATVALNGASLRVAAGECVALVGESGSGKSTLLRTFNRLVVADAGTVEIDGTAAADLEIVPLRRRIGYVPQDGGLLPHWSVRRNAAMVPWLNGRADANALADAALGLVGLDAATFGDRAPASLSGGQRQRAAMARAVAAGPRVILLDEPFGALDAITRADLQQMFLALRRSRQMTAVLVTHDLHEAFVLADRVAVMRAGVIDQVAAPRDLLATPMTGYVTDLLRRARAREDWLS